MGGFGPLFLLGVSLITIVCVKWGELYSSDYVNVLFDMVRRNLREGYPGKFVCYTDDPTGLDAGIEARELPKELEGWWGKLYLFSQLKEKTLFLDLDTVIVGELDSLLDTDEKFIILRDFYRHDGLQSSIMYWNGDYSHIWDEWVKEGSPRVDGGDQAWIERMNLTPAIWQDLFPGKFVSYKANNCSTMFPKGTSVVVFHGLPRPHECGGWVEHVWKVGGGSAAELEVIANVSEDTIFGNISENCAKGLPEVSLVPAHGKVALIVAGGPSLADDIPIIREMEGDIFAVNNTLRYLHKKHIRPDFHVMLDARKENISFVGDADIHYYASQVDPAIVDKASNVVLWHSAVPGSDKKPQIGGATTVGLKAAILAFVLGYREIHLFGFDSCYAESHHAYPQKLNDGERVIDVTFGGETYKCAPWMAQQAREFSQVAIELVSFGCELHVHGSGLIPDIAESMFRPRLAVDDRAEAILEHLPDGKVSGAEIGVFAGELSRRLLEREDLSLLLVDAWEGDGKSYIGDSGDFHAGLSQEQQDAYMFRTQSVTEFAGERRKIVKAYSHIAAESVPDGSLNFVFIDADHGYEGCKRDLEAWWPKVKSGGLFSGHDYENTDFPKFGVTRAVTEFCNEHDLTVELGPDFTWFINKT